MPSDTSPRTLALNWLTQSQNMELNTAMTSAWAEEPTTESSREDTGDTVACHDTGIKPFRTLSIMVNAVCNLACTHCALPRSYHRYGPGLEPSEWGDCLARVIPAIDPAVLSIAAMEPLLPGRTQDKTLAILGQAQRSGVPAGIVTNGMFASAFLSRCQSQGIRLAFLDVSVDGPPELDAAIRGPHHFGAVEGLLASHAAEANAERVYISTTLNRLNGTKHHLSRLFDWVQGHLERPRLVLLPIYPNQHVDTNLFLTGDELPELLPFLSRASRGFEEIFLDVFPSSIPDLAKLVAQGDLPGADQLLRDDTGMLWGHVADNLYVRYSNWNDLLRYQVRLSPEGQVIPPENFERPDYLAEILGNAVSESWPVVASRIETRMAQFEIAGESFIEGLRGEHAHLKDLQAEEGRQTC